jgi:acetylornithine deacetylase/succinyl-diaminopimelate desuccinylase-like protein
MDPLEAVAFARGLIDIDSTTGREREAGDWLADVLRDRGYSVVEQPLARGCSNIVATLDDPVVVLSTHYDCVPPFIRSSVRDGRLYGRGACDAKGILAAQLAAAERLRAGGERRVGLLFVVGEERGSDGANLANDHARESRYLINGEPTDSKLATATRGVLRVKLRARGRACHSAAPEHGVSAIDLLIDALVRLRALPLPVDPDMGATYYTVGLIEGGVAPNVVSPHASAEILFRIVGPADDVLAAIGPLTSTVEIEEVLRVRPVKLRTIEGFESAVFPFTTDVPLLGAWGTPLLFGPGSFLLAHTDEEHLELAEMAGAIDAYERLVRKLLADG